MKKLKQFMLICMSLFLLAGCTGDDNNEEGTSKPNETTGQGGGMKSGGGNGS